jgi:hypothetical protein
MATAATTHSTQATTHRPPLFLAFELGATTWKLGFTIGAAQRPRARRMPAGAVQVLLLDGQCPLRPLTSPGGGAPARLCCPFPGAGGYFALKPGSCGY